MKIIFKFSVSLLALFVLFTSCKKDENTPPVTPALGVPSSYADFTNVSYTGQQHRLAMLGEMKSYMKGAANGTKLDQTRLLSMFENGADAMFSQAYTKQIKSKTFAAVQGSFTTLLTALAQESGASTAATDSTAGIATSNDGVKKYFVNKNGLEYLQIIEKGLMGACFYYQGTSVYLGKDKLGADNETVTDGKGTDRQHHWDEAFGYFGVPKDFPTNTDGVVFWGDYCNDRNDLLNTNKVMEGFLRGRAAIGAKNDTEMNKAVETVRTEWEKVSAGTAVHYLNSALSNFDDKAKRLHALAEAIAFAYSLQFNSTTKINKAAYENWAKALAGSSSWTEMNINNISKDDIKAAKATLISTYELESVADKL